MPMPYVSGRLLVNEVREKIGINKKVKVILSTDGNQEIDDSDLFLFDKILTKNLTNEMIKDL